MHLLKFSQSAVRRLMRLADQVSFGLLVAGTTMLPASAASGTTVWTKASEIMQDVYTQIVSISTITAVVCASVALLLMNFSKTAARWTTAVPGSSVSSSPGPSSTGWGSSWPTSRRSSAVEPGRPARLDGNRAWES